MPKTKLATLYAVVNDPVTQMVKDIKETKEQVVAVDMNMVGKGRTNPKEGALSEFPYIKSEGAIKILDLLKDHKTCTSLDLSGNEIGGSSAAKAIADFLRKNTVLKKLYLENNKFSAADIAIIAEALEDNSTLTELSFNGNKVDNAGAISLAKALRKNKALKVLTLNHNEIRDEGAKEIAKVLNDEVGAPLEVLALNFNAIRDGGAKKLLRNLMSNSTLTTLGLGGNKIQFKAAKYLEELFNSRQDMKNGIILRLNLDQNRISAADMQILQQMAAGARCEFGKIALGKSKKTKSGMERMAAFVKYRMRVKRFYQNGHYRGGERKFF